MADEQRFILGAYTAGPTVEGVGLAGMAVGRLDSATGALTAISEVADAEQASWVQPSPDGRSVYAVGELHGRDGVVHGHAWSESGESLERVSTASARGRAPCHLAATGDRVFAASYSGGLLSVHPVAGATVEPSAAVHRYDGSGPNEKRQRQSHAHQALPSPDGRWLYVCDLGGDRVHVHDLSTATAERVASIEVEPGAGPRHLAFHPQRPMAYVWCELRPIVLEFYWEATSGRLVDGRAHDLAADLELAGVGAGAAVHVHPSGDAVAVSERATGAVCLLGLTEGQIDGQATRFESGATTPRDFRYSPDGRWLLVACQDSHWVRSYRVDDPMRPATEASGELGWRMPVCVSFVPG